jgi:signal transduction histidine kinase
MTPRTLSFISMSSVLTAIISIAMAVGIPLGYFIVAYQYMSGRVHTELIFSARVVESLVNNNPKTWQYEEIRLQEILERRVDVTYREKRLIRDMGGQIIAQTPETPTAPALTFRHPIYDSGAEVAQIELERSIAPLLSRTALIGIFSALAGMSIFLIFRYFPLRAVREAYHNLTENEKRLSLALASGDFGISDWTIGKHTMIWDERMYDIFGVSRDSAASPIEIWRKSLHPEDRERMLEAVRPEAIADRGFNAEYRIVQSDGKIRYIKTDGILLSDDNGKPARLISLNQDVTAGKLAQIQLLQAEKMASIGKLAAGVAHEINNPTAFVSSNLKTLSEYVQDIIAVKDQYKAMMASLKTLKLEDSCLDAIKGHIRHIEELESRLNIDMVIGDIVAVISESLEGTGRITRIVQDLKNFAHPGEEKESMFNVNENIESTLGIVWNELKYKTVVHKDFGDIPRIRGYPQQLNQVFMNLLVNAAQAIKEKGEIRISTRADNGYIDIKIADTGMGIPPENLPKLFDPFFTTKEVGKGTGLGLHVSYSIVEKHHGTIAVESDVGVGTTFTVRIPIRTTD